MSLNELPKQNWVEITKEQLKSIPVGSPIRVDGISTILSYHYKAPSDYGFNTKHVVRVLGGSTFGSFDWNKNIKVEVLMNQGHPHAEQMLQYAKDAMTTAEPWKLWEYREDTKEWFLCTANPYWFTQSEYRRKPITKLIHGVEVPNISFQPKQGEVYNCPNPISNTLSHTGMFSENSAIDLYRKSKNLCYPYTEEGRDAAILHAKAMLGIADA